MAIKPIGFRIENFMRIKLAEIKFGENGEVIWLGGRNDQGKSSCLQAIEDAFCGGRHAKDYAPIHAGADKAVIVGELQTDSGTLIIRKVYTESGARLELASGDGAKFTSPQNKLDEFLGAFVDPEALIKMTAKDRKELLLSMVGIGIDLDKWEKDTEKLYNDRADVNRNIKTLTGKVAVSDREELLGLPEIHEDVAKILAEKKSVEDFLKTRKEHEKGQADIQDAIADLDNEIERLNSTRTQKMSELIRLAEVAEAHENKVPKSLYLPAFDERINNASARNSRIDKANVLRENLAELETEQDKSMNYTMLLHEKERDKAAAMKAAIWPVPGLGVGEEDITHGGVPFSQLSTSKKLMLGMEISKSAQGELKLLLIRDASAFDDDNRKLIEKWAVGNDYHILAEIVGEAGADIVIEDGEQVRKGGNGDGAKQ